MLVGYVSDERHVALSDVQLTFARDGQAVAAVRSDADGGVRADLEPGEYTVTLQKDGYGGKRTTCSVPVDEPCRFRLLSDCLLGYAWPEWARAGERVQYFVHAPEEVRVSLWRYGEHKEFVRLVDWHGEHGPRAGTQLLPDGDFTRTGADWDVKNPAFEDQLVQDVVAPAASGLYYFHLEGKTGDFFSFPLVVAPAQPRADVAVLAATMTWNAYNSFGGRSNYLNPASLPTRPVVHPHQDLDRYEAPGDGLPDEAHLYRHDNDEYEPLSFQRPTPFNHVPKADTPTDPIEGRNEGGTAPAEWRFLAWLEREGFEYDLYAENQLHDGILDLEAYDALVAHTHPEYWTKGMYDAVKGWVVDGGGNLAYLGGNGIDCEVEMVDRTRGRYLDHSSEVRRATTHDASPPGTCESRFHYSTGESAGALLGEVLTETGMMTAAPYEVRDGDHWVFDGTGLSAGDCFGEDNLMERCKGGASGAETDKRSRYAPASFRLLAKGTNPDDGGAEMLYRETDSGGAVFSVGSITYTGSLLVDEATSTITRNVLEAFGAGD